MWSALTALAQCINTVDALQNTKPPQTSGEDQQRDNTFADRYSHKILRVFYQNFSRKGLW